MKNIFHRSAEFIAKHKHHHHIALATLALVIAGAGVYTYRHEIAQAATYTFTQSSWAGGATANTAVHPTNQSSWTQYSANSADITADASSVRLNTVSYSFTDDGTSTTTSPIATGGGFSSGANSSTAISGSGTGASVGLMLNEYGWAVGNSGTIRKTANSGETWSTQTSGTTNGLNNLYFIDSNIGWAVGGSGVIRKTIDGGTNWPTQTSSGITANGVHFIDANTGWVVGGDGTNGIIRKTINGGTSWSTQLTIGGYMDFFDVHFIDANTGWAVGNQATIKKTIDGGTTWSTQTSARSAELYAVHFIDTNTGWVVGAYGIQKTIDGGTTWSTQTSETQWLRGVHFIDANIGWAVGGSGVIRKTIDGGTNWPTQTSGTTQQLRGVHFTDANTGWAVGAAGTILKTTNGGTTWTAQTSGTTQNLNNLYFVSYYSNPGTFTSADIDLGANVIFSGKTLDWTESLNGGDIQIQMRSATTQGGLSGATWYGPTGTGDYYTASGGSSINTVHNGHRWIQYRATLTTPNTALTPTLDSVTINYTQYASAGDLTSSKYDVGSDTLISRLSWVASTTTTETVAFQVQSSPDNSTWTGWCGFSETGPTCDGSNYFTDAHNGVALGTSHPLRSGTGAGADRYFQYKVFLVSGGAVTPELTSVTVQYVINAPPDVQNVTAVQNADGTVTVNFDMRDTDTNDAGAATPGKVISTLQYNNAACGAGPSWADAAAVTGAVGANTTITATYPTSASSTITWTPSTDWSDKYCATQQVRIKLNDSEGANNLGYSTAASFLLDTTAPVVASTGGFLVDSSVGGAGLAGIKLTATDDSTMQYRLCNNSDFTADGLNSGAGACTEWSSASASVDLTTSANSWNTALGADGTETVYMQVRDLYGNVTSRTASAPTVPPSFIATDTTNLNSDTYREFLSWGKASSTTFGSYKVYYNTTGSGASYSLLGTVTDVNQNYYTHTITTATSSTHYYKMVTVSANGDISEFTSVKSDVPDGSGSTDVTAPYIPYAGIAVSSVRNTSANITFSTYTDVSLAEGELATSTVRYASYTGNAPTSCPTTSSTNSNTYVVNHSVYLTDLTPSTSYVFCVLAKDISGNVSTASYVAESGGTFTTIGGPRITGVTQREITDTSATIFWNTDTSSDSKVYFSTSAGGVNGATPVTGAVVTTSGTNENGTFYQHQIGLTGLTPGLTYYYKVSSTDALDSELVAIDDNTGQYYSFVTLKDTTPPIIMGTSTPVLAPTAAVIVWQTDEMADSQVFYDTVSHGTDTSLYPKYTATQSYPTSVKSIYHVMTLSSDTANSGSGGGTNALIKETQYYYVVKSTDSAGNSSVSTGTFTTPADGNVTITVVRVTQASEGTPPDTAGPVLSSVKVSDITPFGATVSFDTNEDAVSFVEYGKSASFGDSAGSKTWSKTHSIKLRGLTLGTEYYIKVSAVDKAGNTGTGGEQTFKTSFLSEDLKDLTKIENIEQFQKEIEATIESILPSLVPPFITKPVISDITEGSAKISFRTNIKAFPVVVFAEDGVYDETKENPYTGEMSDTTEKATSHELALTGLKGNTKYHIQARGFSLPKVIGKSADVTFITKASKIAGSIVERKKDSFTVVWTTEQPTSSIVEFKDLKRGITGRKTDDAKKKSHSMKIENLPSGTAYEVNLSGVTEQGNVAEAGSPISVTTSTDTTPPVISGFKVDNALVPGRTDRIQTIVSWVTDEPSDSTVYYQEGAGTPGDTEELANKNEVLDSYITNHSVILPSLKPGTIYRLKVTSSDDSGNLGSFGPRTVITPKQTESITDIIFKNFEDSFKFLQKI